MSQQDVERLRRAYEAATRGDLEAALTYAAPEIEFHLTGVFPDLEPVYRGRAEVERFYEKFFEPWEELSMEPDRIIDLGDRILVLLHFRARGREGIEVELPLAQIWTLRHGLAIRMDAYSDRQIAFEAAGLSNQNVVDIETLRTGYEAFSRGDWDAAFRDWHPDFELETADRVANPGTYRGLEEARRFYEDLLEPFEEVVIEPEQFFQRGDQTVVFVLVRCRPRGSNAMVGNRIGHLWTFRDGKAVRCELFPEREKALDALGLSG